MTKFKLVMACLTVTSLVSFAVPLLSPVQISVAQTNAPDAYTVRYTVEFSKDDLSFDQLKGYDVVGLMGGDYLSDIGKPMLPWKELKIALPSGMAVTSISVVDTKSETIPGEYNVFPAQPPVKIGLSSTDVAFVEPDPQTYGSLQPYPPQLVEFGYQADLAGQGIAVIQLYPVQYVPKEKRLTLYTSITLEIAGAGGYECGDYLSPNISETERKDYEERVKEMVENPEKVQLVSAFKAGASFVPPGGPFAHVIITSSTFAATFQWLADWHTQRGLKDTVITTAWIYANYSGTADSVKIRAFVRDAHLTWGTTFFLLVGENETVPFCRRTYIAGEENTPSDEYYADYDNDWIHEVFVGRLSVGTTSEGINILNKILKYEKDPPRTNYPLDVLLIGMDLDASTPSQALKEVIRGYIPARFHVSRVYDSHGGNHYDSSMYYLNAGQNLVNHSDHSNIDVMCVGDFRHGWCIYNSDVDALNNYDQTSNVVSVGCFPNAMDANDCIAEHFVIYNPHQAGISFTGNTRDGLYYAGQPQSLSLILDREWWASLFNRNKYRLGQAIADAKEHYSTPGATEKHCEWTFNLLGEPEMSIWTDEPDSFAVTCADTFEYAKSSFFVHVEDSTTHVPVESAYVCLWKANEIYLTGYTDANGDKTFSPLPLTIGTMYVTTTKHNYIPSEKLVVIPHICGDINGDNVVDVGDLVLLIGYLYRGGPAPNPMEWADMNLDGLVNLADTVYLISYLYKGGLAPCAG